MTTAIEVRDTNTGTELSVRDVTRELARQDEAEYLPCPWGEQIEADLGRSFAAWSGQLDAFAADIRAVLAEHQHEPEPVFAELPPDPALQLAPAVLDAEHDDRIDRMINDPEGYFSEARRRAGVLAPVGQRVPTTSRCGLTTPGLFGANLICVEPADHDLPHRTADDTEWRPSVRQLRAGKTEPFTPKVPWRLRLKRGVVGYLEQIRREKAMK